MDAPLPVHGATVGQDGDLLRTKVNYDNGCPTTCSFLIRPQQFKYKKSMRAGGIVYEHSWKNTARDPQGH